MKNKRTIKKIIYIRCEGKTEVAFLKHIKNLYLSRETGQEKMIKIKSEEGGSLQSMQKSIQKEKEVSHIDESYILLDGDIISRQNKDHSHPDWITDIWITKPCLEGFLLDVIGYKKPQKSKECKKQFEKNILNAKDKLKSERYNKIFTKVNLEEKRNDIPLLNKILTIFRCDLCNRSSLSV